MVPCPWVLTEHEEVYLHSTSLQLLPASLYYIPYTNCAISFPKLQSLHLPTPAWGICLWSMELGFTVAGDRFTVQFHLWWWKEAGAVPLGPPTPTPTAMCDPLSTEFQWPQEQGQIFKQGVEVQFWVTAHRVNLRLWQGLCQAGIVWPEKKKGKERDRDLSWHSSQKINYTFFEFIWHNSTFSLRHLCKTKINEHIIIKVVLS